jgi:peptidoglycan/xylan/chitin deacetylase (PgdA/CDA1 family)
MHNRDAPRQPLRTLATLAFMAFVVLGCTAPATTPPPTEASPAPGASVTPVPTSTATATPSATPSPTSPPSPSPTPPLPSSTATPGYLIYTVERGDSLSLIAARFDTTWQSLVYWNRDRYPSLDPEQSDYDPNRIEVGWQLVVWPAVDVAYDPALPTPTPPAAASAVVSYGSRSSSMVALTFDMGGRTDPAIAIMSWLRDHGVPATIFMTGASVDSTTAGRQVISIVNAHPDMFDLGNHSYGHPDMTTLSAGQVADELRRAETAIDAYADQSPRPLFRPPYGAWDGEVLAGAGSVGYRWTVMWDVDTIDWKPISVGGPTAVQIVEKVLGRAQGGSIVLMHLGGYETLDALPGIVAGLRGQGYSLVTLGTLIGE